MRMTDDKMITFDKYQKPRDTTGLRKFLGSLNFFRRFFNNLASEAIPLYKLAQGKKKMRIVWNEEAERAFESRALALVSATAATASPAVAHRCLALSQANQEELSDRVCLYWRQGCYIYPKSRII